MPVAGGNLNTAEQRWEAAEQQADTGWVNKLITVEM